MKKQDIDGTSESGSFHKSGSGLYSLGGGSDHSEESPFGRSPASKSSGAVSASNGPVSRSPASRSKTLLGISVAPTNIGKVDVRAKTEALSDDSDDTVIMKRPVMELESVRPSGPVRYNTIAGLDITEDLDAVQQHRQQQHNESQVKIWETAAASVRANRLAEEQAKREAEVAEVRRHATLNDFLGQLENTPFVLAKHSVLVAMSVTAAFAALGREHKSTSALSVGKVSRGNAENLPTCLQAAVTAAIKAEIDAVEVSLVDILKMSGVNMGDFPVEARQRIAMIAENMAESLSDEVKSVIDPIGVETAFRAAIAYRAKAVLNGEGFAKVNGFVALFVGGWIPVGVMKDGSFLILTA